VTGRAARDAPPGGGRIAARCIVLDAARHLAPGEVVWDARGRIVRLRRAPRAESDLCLLPGLVDAHVHLQLRPIPRAPRAFVPWIGAVMAARADETPAACRAEAQRSVEALLADGVTAFGEIDSTGESLGALALARVAGRCYREVTGFHLGRREARALVKSLVRGPRGAVTVGLSPHAPYSVSADLFTAARGAASHLAVHCAETPEEQRFLRRGGGPFASLLASLGRLPADFRPPGVGAVRWLERLRLLGPRTQLVHCQELERGDAARIAASGAPVVVCPGTIRWFRRQPPPVPQWLRAGIPVALGTDSRASNARFSLRAELVAAARSWPELRPRHLLAMATELGGRALGQRALGRLRTGGRADFVAVAGDGPLDRIVDEFVHGRRPPVLTVVAGACVRALRR
jgi:cytosine/adenosine deaminase-related metal-dependent hydrolase